MQWPLAHPAMVASSTRYSAGALHARCTTAHGIAWEACCVCAAAHSRTVSVGNTDDCGSRATLQKGRCDDIEQEEMKEVTVRKENRKSICCRLVLRNAEPPAARWERSAGRCAGRIRCARQREEGKPRQNSSLASLGSEFCLGVSSEKLCQKRKKDEGKKER